MSSARRLAASSLAFVLCVAPVPTARAATLDATAGNFVVEALLGGGLTLDGQGFSEFRACDSVGTKPSQRWATAPVVYFEDAPGTPSETQLSAMLNEQIPRLTGLVPTYWSGGVPTPEQRATLFVVLVGSGATSITVVDNTITGAVVGVDTGTNGISTEERPVVLHAIAHALGGGHWFTRDAAVLGVHDVGGGSGAPDFHPAEIAGFNAIYSLPPGTLLSQLADVVPEEAEVFNPPPLLDRTDLVTATYPATAGDAAYWNHAAVGEDIFLRGQRLSTALRSILAGQAEARYGVPPVVSFNGVEVVPVIDDAHQAPPRGVAGAESMALRVTVPPGAVSGPLTLWTRNQTTAPIAFTVDGASVAGVPGEATALAYVAPVDREVVITWTPPTTYLDGTPFTAAGSTVHVLRDGIEVAAGDGATTGYTDVGMAIARSSHLYQVQYEAGGVFGPPSDALAFRVPGDVDFPEPAPGARCPSIAGGLSGPLCPAVATPFTDIATSFARDSISCVFARKISVGTGPTTFSPGDPVTRGQMAVFLMATYEAARGMPYIDGVRSSFDDIAGHFAEARIQQLDTLDVTSGTSTSTFSPDLTVTREQMAVFIMNLWEEIVERPYDGPVVTTFTDISGSFAATRIEQLAGLGITSGTSPGLYSPGAAVTRDQMATFLVNLLEVLA